MKKIYLTVLSSFIAIVTMAQTPGFSYQAVILNPDAQILPGNNVEQGLLSESDIAIRFTIENESGTEYQETHTTKTDAYGMVSLMVGQGTVTIGNFTDITWSGLEKYLKVEIDFTASGASYENLDRQALTYLPQPLSLESNNRINDLELAINTVASDLINIELTPGPQGIQGPAGNDGVDGTPGVQGPPGNDGIDGNDGVDGTPGVQGPPGNDGAVGATGPPGNDGVDGNDGAVGAIGPQGPPGGGVFTFNANGTGIQAPTDTASGDASTAMGYQTTASGNYSTAMGDGTTASGYFSTAMGEDTESSGWGSTAMGHGTTASGDFSTAMGYQTEASGLYSTAMGQSTLASGASSTAMGYQTTASGNYSTAMGDGTTASGYFSTAMGDGTTASGTYSTAMGYDTEASGTISTAMGRSTQASGQFSTAMGEYTEASGWSSTAMGGGTEALDSGSTAMGWNTEASGAYSTAMGEGTTASGDASIAMGASTTASGTISTAMGRYTEASGQFSTAMGNVTEASGWSSTAMGGGTEASGVYSTAMGRYNVGGGDSINWVATDPLFEIGNGSYNNNRNNALTIYKDGRADFDSSVTATHFIGDGSGLTNLPSTPSAVTYSIGDTAQGGIVFYVSPDGKNGLVAATVDQSTSSNWYDASNVISSPLNHTSEGQKFLDWRLPTKHELNEMYLNIGQGNALGLGNIGSFTIDLYWSSTEVDVTNAWNQGFNDGNQYSTNKNFNLGDVRAVRAF